MAKIEIPYTPRYPEVHEILERTRFTVIVAHRRFGKTVLALNHLIKMALLQTKSMGRYAFVAPYLKQAKENTWEYFKHYTATLPNREVNESECSIRLPNGARIRLFGADNPDALRGPYLDGVILDEVAQMKPELWGEVVRPMLMDRPGWAVFIGTPKGINLFSELYNRASTEQANGNPNWAALCYPVNVTNALPPGEVEDARRELSENAFRQEMLCDFNASNDDNLISQDEVEGALAREPNWEIINQYPLIVGVDVARFGGDSTVFFGRRHNYAYRPVVLNGYSNTEVAHRLMAHIAEFHPSQVNIDQGQGTGVIDLVRDLTHTRDVIINEIPFGSKAGQPEKYFNRRAEMWVHLRDWLRAGGILPNYNECANALRLELCAPMYSFDNQGRIKLEPKENIKERIQRSPDLGDALALTFATDTYPDERAVFPNLERKYGPEAGPRMRNWIIGKREKKEWQPW